MLQITSLHSLHAYSGPVIVVNIEASQLALPRSSMAAYIILYGDRCTLCGRNDKVHFSPFLLFALLIIGQAKGEDHYSS